MVRITLFNISEDIIRKTGWENDEKTFLSLEGTNVSLKGEQKINLIDGKCYLLIKEGFLKIYYSLVLKE